MAPSLVSSPAGHQGQIIPEIERQGKFATEPECDTRFVKEIEFERFRHNYTFEEAEEISQDLDKIRRWFKRIVERDWFAAHKREAAEASIDRCQALLEAFEQDVYARDSEAQGAPPEAQGLIPPVDRPRNGGGLDT